MRLHSGSHLIIMKSKPYHVYFVWCKMWLYTVEGTVEHLCCSVSMLEWRALVARRVCGVWRNTNTRLERIFFRMRDGRVYRAVGPRRRGAVDQKYRVRTPLCPVFFTALYCFVLCTVPPISLFDNCHLNSAASLWFSLNNYEIEAIPCLFRLM